jgi:hypothetical protein
LSQPSDLTTWASKIYSLEANIKTFSFKDIDVISFNTALLSYPFKVDEFPALTLGSQGRDFLPSTSPSAYVDVAGGQV